MRFYLKNGPKNGPRCRPPIRSTLRTAGRVLRLIDAVLRRVSPYAQNYRRLKEVADAEEARARAQGIEPAQWQLRMVRDPRDDQRRYNAPTTNKECMYLIESAEGNVERADLAVHPRGQFGCKRINFRSRHVDPMVFTILFPAGDS